MLFGFFFKKNDNNNLSSVPGADGGFDLKQEKAAQSNIMLSKLGQENYFPGSKVPCGTSEWKGLYWKSERFQKNALIVTD